jgi:hypothetical protein
MKTEEEENEDPKNRAMEELEDENEASNVNNMIHTAAVAQQLATNSLVTVQRVITEHQEQLASQLERQEDQERLKRILQEVRQVTTEQRWVTNQLNAQRWDGLNAWLRTLRIQHPSPSRATPRRRTPNLDLARASVWREGILLWIWRDRLLGAAASAVITAAELWVAAVSTATICWIFRR